MSKFEEQFSEPLSFSEGGWALSRESLTKEEAIEWFEQCTGDKVKRIEEGTVRFCFMEGYDFLFEDKNRPVWVEGKTGRGSKKIWMINK